MKMSAKDFLTCNKKQITLLGMSGAGKTTLANKLSPKQWFHYSGDYRIGTQYLSEPILDNIKQQAMDVPFLKDLLISDSIYICNNMTVDNLTPISSFMGKIGDPALGGLSLETFKDRQLLHLQAEIAAMKDVPKFIKKAQNIYDYKHFINDAGGSVCELNNPEVLNLLAKHTLIIYIKTSEEQEQLLFDRAQQDPKPLYYRADFLDENLKAFMHEYHYTHTEQIPPNEFVSWVFPKLFRARLPRYQAIADQYGYTVDASAIAQVKTEAEFINLIAQTLDHDS
ncbi:MAG TPA: ATPase [Methylococcaceae bacterium]|jgi:shikimate kinase|nr:ATPase [Methylococcaceae bacterium]HIN67779.1 ATPase [Methylococcales bacterium]HIA44743.1 ATPase [Methylococcaceae bacterium]HIB61681.1 ATPase [Methylococcaceae bacterium]HIO12156.1 ATPase [Methylococcales bacterium]